MIYEYVCKKCMRIFEKSYIIGKQPNTVQCVDCGEKSTRYFSAPQIIARTGFFSQAHNCKLGSSHHVREFKKIYHDQTGSHVEEADQVKINRKTKRLEYTES